MLKKVFNFKKMRLDLRHFPPKIQNPKKKEKKKNKKNPPPQKKKKNKE